MTTSARPGRRRPAASTATGSTAATPILSDEHVAALVGLGNRASGIAELAGFDRGGGLVGDHGVGSNNWVVSGDRTASGKPILANDPHLGFGMPSIWIMNGLHCRTLGSPCPWDVVGVTFPGAPGVVLGHNAQIAWGATNVNPDTQDLFLETVDPANPANYLYQGASVPFEIRHETIKVANGADVEIDVRSTRHGVVLSDVDERLKDRTGRSWRCAGRPRPRSTWPSNPLLELDLATNFDEFRAAFDGYGSPSQNFIYADVEGNIGYVLPGLIPIRDTAAAIAACPVERGLHHPVGHWRAGPGRHRRQGTNGRATSRARSCHGSSIPPPGQIVSANNAPVDDEYAFWIGNEYDPGYRAARISELLGEHEDGSLTAEHMRQLQMDSYLGRADRVIPALIGLVPTPGTQDGRDLWTAITALGSPLHRRLGRLCARTWRSSSR